MNERKRYVPWRRKKTVRVITTEDQEGEALCITKKTRNYQIVYELWEIERESIEELKTIASKVKHLLREAYCEGGGVKMKILEDALMKKLRGMNK